MNHVEKNEILQQVGSILHFCHEIVSRLSTLESSAPVQHQVNFPEVNNNFDESNASWREDSSCPDDDVKEGDCQDDDLWWWDGHTLWCIVRLG